MLYVNLTSKKIASITGLLAFLAFSLSATFIGIKSLRLPPGYFSIDNFADSARLPVLASVYGLDYERQNYGQVSASAPNRATDVPVLLYHGVVAKSDRFSLTADQLKEQLFALKKAGYQTIRLTDFEAWKKGERELAARSFLLTFDDGRNDSYDGADPLLKALDFTAVMFVATHLSWR
jgi:hypothetical protein